MLSRGWTPNQFEKRIGQYDLGTIMLALNPRSAITATPMDAVNHPTDHGLGNAAKAEGVDIG